MYIFFNADVFFIGLGNKKSGYIMYIRVRSRRDAI